MNVSSNTFTGTASASTFSFGIDMSGCNGVADATSINNQITVVNNNIFSSMGGRGIYVSSTNGRSTANPNEYVGNVILGNFRGTSTYQPLYFSGVTYSTIAHNSAAINFSNTSTSSGVFYMTSGNNVKVYNNTFIGNGSSNAVYLGTNTTCTFSNNNLFNWTDNSASAQLVSVSGITYNKTQLEANAIPQISNANISTSQGWSGLTSLSGNNGCVLGASLATAGVTTPSIDINGNTRNVTSPTIGAYQIIGVTDDAAVLGVFIQGTAGNQTLIAGQQVVKVLVRNAGTNTLTSVSLQYTVNGNITNQTFSGLSLASCTSDTLTFTSSFTLNSGCVPVSVQVNDVNGSFDNNVNNDLRSTQAAIPISAGTYTINSGLPASSSNFTSFAGFMSAASCGGFVGSGNVIVNVNGVYNEQVTFGTIQGLSPTRRLIFQGTDTINSGIWFAGSAAAPHTLRFNTGAQYITFQDMHIRGNNVTNAYAVHVFGNAVGLEFKRCNITTASSTVYTNVPVMFAASTSTYTTGVAASDILIEDNYIYGGTDGIVVTSTSTSTTFAAATHCDNIRILRNRIVNSNGGVGYGAIHMRYVRNATVVGNFMGVEGTGTQVGGYYGCYFGNMLSAPGLPTRINNNTVNAASTTYGYYFTASNGPAGVGVNGWNEFIGNQYAPKNGETQTFGAYFASSTRWKMYHNTIYQNNPSATAYGLYITGSATDSHQIINNSLVSVLGAPLYLGVTPSASWVITNNNFYNLGSTTLATAGTSYTPSTIGTFQTGNISVNQGWMSSENLAISNPCANGIALGITTDAAGNARNATNPDMGALEAQNLAANDVAVVDVINPTNPTSATSQNAKVVVKNNGTATLSSFNVYFSVNGALMGSEAITGVSIAPCDTKHITFTTPFTPTGGCNSFTAFTILPNGSADGNPTNDSLTIQFGVAVTGTLTLNSGAPATSTNYTSFADLFSALNCSGVGTGGVTINVTGVYNVALTLNPIPGASASNRIRFVGVDTATSKISIANATSPYATIQFNTGANYYTFENMTIEGTSTTGARPVYCANQVEGITFKNCALNVPSNQTTTAFVPVYFSNTTGQMSNFVIEGNTLRGGYYGIYIGGQGSLAGSNPVNRPTNFLVKNNRISDAYFYGIYLYGTNGTQLIGNNIDIRTVGTTTNSSYGVYAYYNGNSSTQPFKFNNNTIRGWQNYGAYFYSFNAFPAQSPTSTWYGHSYGMMAEINGNLIPGSGLTVPAQAFYGTGMRAVNLYHNTFLTIASSFAMQINSISTSYSTDSCNIRNNTLMTKTASVMTNNTTTLPSGNYPLWANVDSFCTVGPNNYYVVDYPEDTSRSLANIEGMMFGANPISSNFYYRKDSILGATGTSINNSSSYNFSQGITSLTNPIPADGCLNGINLGVGADINGVTRSPISPDMGAFEVPTPTNDAQVYSIPSPVNGAPGSQNVVAKIKNNGSVNITSITLKFSLNNGTTSSETFTGLNLAPCDTQSLYFTTTTNIPGGCNSFRVMVDGVNGGSDGNAQNDTFVRTVSSPMSGTYTIGVSGADYSSVTAAIDALKCSGVNGAVTFNIASGTYNETNSIPAISGASASNTITFQSAFGNHDSVVINYATTTSNLAVLKFINAQYVTLKNLTIQNTVSTSSSRVVEISGANVLTLENVKILSPTTNITSFGLYNYTAGSDSVTLKNCLVVGGYYGIYNYGSSTNRHTATTITNSTVSNAYYYGIYCYYNDGLVITENTANGFGNTINYGIYSFYLYNSVRQSIISRNRIRTNGGYGIYCYYTDYGVNGVRTPITNNMLSVGSSTTTATSAGIYTFGLRATDIHHNSVRVEGTGTCYGLYYNTATSGVVPNTAYNNIIANFGANASAYAFYYGASSTYNGSLISDSNNIYSDVSGNVAYYSPTTSTYSSLGAFAAASGTNYLDTGSVSIMPQYLAIDDLHLSGNSHSSLGNRGKVLASITTDFDGQTRCPNVGCPGATSNPDLGADEFEPLASDAGAIAVVTNSFCPGVSGPVTIRVKNYAATDTMTSITINWELSTNGGSWVAQTPYTATGLTVLPNGTSDLVVGNLTLSVGNVYQVRSFTSDPNGIADLNNINDTIVGAGFSASISGTITVGGATPTYPTLDAAFADLSAKGVCGPATLLVRSMSITTPVQLNNIPGASSTNTILITPDSGATVSIAVPTNAISGTYALNIKQADYVTINGFNISRTGSNTNGWVVLLSGGNDGVELRNNVITAPTGTSTSYVPIYNSSSINDSLTDVKIVGNTINNGYYGMYLYGTSARREIRTIIDSNTFNGQYYYGFYGYYIGDGMKVRYNTISKNSNSNTTNYGFLTYYGASNSVVGQSEIAFNRVTGNNLAANTTYGVYVGYFTGGVSLHDNFVQVTNRALYLYGNTFEGNVTYKTRVFNNQFIQEVGTPVLQGMVYLASNGSAPVVCDFVHNNIAAYNITGSGVAAVVIANAMVQDSLVFANNNIYTGAGGAIPALIYGTPGVNGLVDRNNYKADNASWYAGRYNTVAGNWTNYSDKSSWNSATGMDTNSLSVDPGYLSATDLHVTNHALDGSGIYLADYPTDMDGQSRNTTTPDIGSDEFTPSPYDIAVISSPYPVYVGGCTASANDSIVIRLKNFGTSTVNFGSGDSLYAVITGVNPQMYGVALSGSIIAGGTMDVTVTTSYNLTVVGTHTINAYGVFNSFADGFAGNNKMVERSVVRPASITATNSTPYNQGFEFDITNSWMNSGTKNWITRSGAGSTTTTGPGSAFQGTRYMVVPNLGATTIDNYIIESPCMDLSGMSCAAATFRTHMYGANIGTLRLEASTNGGQTWNTVWSKVGQQQTSRAAAWTLNTVDIASYATSSTSFRFRYDGIIGTSTMEVAVDTFCLAPSTTTTLAADAAKTAGSTCDIFTFVDRTAPASVFRKWKISPPNFSLYGGTTLYDSILKVTFTNSGAYVISLDTVTTVCGSTQVGPGTSTKIISIAAPAGAAGVWTGAQDADWNNGCNWADGLVPSTGNVIAIPANMPNYPSISGNVSVNDLSISSGANLNISSGQTITVLGNINISGLVTGNGNIKVAGSGNQSITAGYMPSTTFGKDTSTANQNQILSASQYGLVLDFARQAILQSVDVKINNSTSVATIVLRNSSNVTLFSTTVTPSGTNGFQTVNLNWTVPAGTGYKLVMVTPISGSATYGMSNSGISYPYAASNYVKITSSWTGVATTTTSYYHFFNVKVSGGTTLANLNLEKTSGDVVLQDNVGVNTLTLNVGNGVVKSAGIIDQDLQTNYDNVYITDGSASAVSRVGGTDSTNYIQGRMIRQVSAGATGTYLFPVGFYNAKGDTTDRRNGKVKGFYSPMAIQFTTGSATDGTLNGSYYDYDPMWYTGNINNRDTVAGAYDLFDSVSGGAVDVKMNALWRVENEGLTNFVYNWEVAGATFDSTGNVSDELAGSTLRLVKKEVWNTGNWEFQGKNAVAGLISDFTAKNAARRDSLTSFSSVSVAGNGRGKSGEGLPVEFVSFTAKKVDRNAVLTWVTAAEINVNAFVIERSIDGKNFEEIGRKNPQGPSTYNFTDLRPVAGTNYYRIKTFDNDGSIGYSPVRSLRFTDAISSMNVFPNPFVSNLGVELNASKAGVAQITIMDVTGRKVLMSVNSNVKNGKNFIQLPQADELATGSYLLKVEFAGDVVWTKLVKN
jgi:parallel beta-helix repeat protein